VICWRDLLDLSRGLSKIVTFAEWREVGVLLHALDVKKNSRSLASKVSEAAAVGDDRRDRFVQRTSRTGVKTRSLVPMISSWITHDSLEEKALGCETDDDVSNPFLNLHGPTHTAICTNVRPRTHYFAALAARFRP